MWRRLGVACVLGAFLGLLMGSVAVQATAPTLYAHFSYSMDKNVVQFADESTGYNLVRWQWTFGDGSTSEEQNPVHTYTEVRSYTVKLIVTDVDGVATETTSVVVISEVPPVEVNMTIVAIAMIVLGLIVVAISKSNYSRIAAAMIVLIGLILWVLGSGGI